MKAHISKIRIYPIKSLGYIEIDEATIGVHSLKNDRLFAMLDKDGRYVNGKRTNKVNLLKTNFDLVNNSVEFSTKENGEQATFELRQGNPKLDDYLSSFFDIPLNLIQNEQGQLMDIPLQSSLTVVSKASLQSLQNDLNRHSLESLRLRFRTNVELAGVDAFWEERLFQEPGVGMRFKMGEVELIGISPRARCNVPPQNPETGEFDYHFVKDMVASRDNSFQENNRLKDFGRTNYFLTVNVFIPKSEEGKPLNINDQIEILEPVALG